MISSIETFPSSSPELNVKFANFARAFFNARVLSGKVNWGKNTVLNADSMKDPWFFIEMANFFREKKEVTAANRKISGGISSFGTNQNDVVAEKVSRT